MSLRACFGAWAMVVLVGAAIAGCADGGSAPMRDGGGRRDGSVSTMDSGVPIDAAQVDAPEIDSGRGDAATCEACTTDLDCADGRCAELASGGSACLPGCNIDLPDCPPRFECVANFTSSIPEPICAPVGERCCVDDDGDLYGSGVGCLGLDCDETDTEVNAAGTETCDGTDEDCDGRIDEGDPAVICPGSTHVATTVCTDGACAIDTCEPGFDDCNSTADDGCETDIDSITDCGSCGSACALPHVMEHACDKGGCLIVTCEAGFGDCNGRASDGCEQPLDTNTHCGGCGVTCGLPNATSTCSTGTCEVEMCDRNWGNCDGRPSNGCETPLTTNTDCGTCGTVCEPPSGTGTCSTGTCRVTTCAAGSEDCNMDTSDGCETSIRTLTNCGACGVSCSFANGVASCGAGACTLADCVPGFGNCDGVTSNGCESQLNTVTSCGACGRACAPAHATGDCTSGSCGIARCDVGWADCDGNPLNGCETSTRTTSDCGACGVSCSRSGAVADCSTGTCHIGSCVSGSADCDGVDANGCETSTRTTTDCAGCGVSCSRPNATATCGTGSCSIQSCSPGFANCDGIDPNGCETSLSTLTSCGGCGVACARANATADCSSGSCRISFCNPGFANCDGVDANGCETPLTTLSNCGACGTSCALANAGESCATGVCQITTCSTGFDDCDGDDATGCETSLRSLTNCGACGVACSRAGATATCATGTCSIASCSAGSGNCDGNDANGCEASLSSLTHCGACGAACDLANASETCPGGTCTLGTCSPGFGNCDGSSTNGCETSLTTLTSCGTCGTACNLANASESCATGTCEITTCSAGFADCDASDSTGCERSIRTVTDCGGCNVTCTRAGASATCATGTCAIASCNSGFGNCDAVDANGCETPLNTLASCGACGATCDLPNATESCTSGTCTLGTCAPGYGNCDGSAANGCETPLNTLTNCGACGVLCDLPGAGESCATGTCQLSGCASGFADCDMMSGNGCETPTTTLTNCGGCGTACNLPHASESCTSGTCAITTCDPGFGNCDGLSANGCETPLDTLSNCGGCGTLCDRPNASETCPSGTCTLGACNPGFGNCDSNAGNGCEAPLTSLTNCGGCGVACNLANAGESCSTGTCEVTTCSAGFGNCDGMAANGCEVNTTNTLAHCGGCNMACAPANATGMCVSGACGIAACNAGWGNCDGNAANGCETPLNTTGNCGGCGVACDYANATETCMTGTCAFVGCSAGFGNCDGMLGNGCEAPLNTAANCGACGSMCNPANATSTCSTGSCTITGCSALWGNCDGAVSNGCETPLTSVSNCGGCGVGCSRPNSTATCSSGTCQIGSCSSGWGNCDGNDPNGCESNLGNDLTHCGSCATSCVSPTRPNVTGSVCSSGSCRATMCSGTWFDVNQLFSDGCECQSDSYGNNCGAAAPIGPVAIDGSTTVTGNLTPQSTTPPDSDWFAVTFATGPTCNYNPKVVLSAGSEPIRFRVWTTCASSTASGSIMCAEGYNTTTQMLTTWELTYNGTSCGDFLGADPTPDGGPFIGTPSTVYVEVLATGSSSTCMPYTLTITN